MLLNWWVYRGWCQLLGPTRATCACACTCRGRQISAANWQSQKQETQSTCMHESFLIQHKAETASSSPPVSTPTSTGASATVAQTVPPPGLGLLPAARVVCRHTVCACCVVAHQGFVSQHPAGHWGLPLAPREPHLPTLLTGALTQAASFWFFFFTNSRSSKSTQDCAWKSGRLQYMIQWIPAKRGTWQRPRVHMRI